MKSETPAWETTVMLAMNARQNVLIGPELGEDVGRMLPGGIDGGWVTTEAVKDV